MGIQIMSTNIVQFIPLILDLQFLSRTWPSFSLWDDKAVLVTDCAEAAPGSPLRAVSRRSSGKRVCALRLDKALYSRCTCVTSLASASRRACDTSSIFWLLDWGGLRRVLDFLTAWLEFQKNYLMRLAELVMNSLLRMAESSDCVTRPRSILEFDCSQASDFTSIPPSFCLSIARSPYLCDL